jgi:hypothetical protein
VRPEHLAPHACARPEEDVDELVKQHHFVVRRA